MLRLLFFSFAVDVLGAAVQDRWDFGSDPADPAARSQNYKWDYTILGHRGGSSGFIPEHSIMSYTIGAQHGADYLEPDVCFTSDGVAILRHHPDLTADTNVVDVYGNTSKRTEDDEILFYWRTSDEGSTGEATEYPETSGGFYTWDFTYEETQSLSLIADDLQPSPFDAMDLKILKLDELLTLIETQLSPVLQRPIGVIPEIKYSHEYAQELGVVVEPLVLEILAAHKYLDFDADANYYSVKTLCEYATEIGLTECDESLYGNKPSVILQSFNAPSLKIFRNLTDAPLIYLGYYNYDLMDETFVNWVMTFADGLGLNSAGMPVLNATLTAMDALDDLVIFEYTFGFSVAQYFDTIQYGFVDGLFTDDSNTIRVIQETLDYVAENDFFEEDTDGDNTDDAFARPFFGIVVVCINFLFFIF